jgi:hypothetical protein
MSTVNGCGTLYYDWSHLPDGTAEATKWFVVAFLPLVPLRREHLQVITHGEKPSFLSLKSSSAWTVQYQVFNVVPMSYYGVARTYAKAYLLLPIVLLAPLLLAGLILKLLYPQRLTAGQMTTLEISAVVIAYGSVLLFWGIVVSRILDRAFYGEKKSSRESKEH